MPVTKGAFVESVAYGSGANGFGSSYTKVRRFTSTPAIGPAISATDSTVNGASYTILRGGLYAITYADIDSSYLGVSKNTTAGTSSIEFLPYYERIAMTNAGGSLAIANCTAVVRLAVGDVIRPHSSSGMGGNDARAYFEIRHIAE